MLRYSHQCRGACLPQLRSFSATLPSALRPTSKPDLPVESSETSYWREGFQTVKKTSGPGVLVETVDHTIVTGEWKDGDIKTGDFSRMGVQTSEYYLVDTDVKSDTIPFEFPRGSGKQLRYGGRSHYPKDGLEGLSPCATVEEGPDGPGGCFGRR